MLIESDENEVVERPDLYSLYNGIAPLRIRDIRR